MTTYSNFQKFKQLYDEIKNTQLWIVKFVPNGKIIGYVSESGSIYGKSPVYEKYHKSCPLNLENKEDLFTALSTNNVYETKDKADAVAEKKNKLYKMYTTHYSDIEKVEDESFEKQNN